MTLRPIKGIEVSMFGSRVRQDGNVRLDTLNSRLSKIKSKRKSKSITEWDAQSIKEALDQNSWYALFIIFYSFKIVHHI